jgi:hypothetical protein
MYIRAHKKATPFFMRELILQLFLSAIRCEQLLPNAPFQIFTVLFSLEEDEQTT